MNVNITPERFDTKIGMSLEEHQAFKACGEAALTDQTMFEAHILPRACPAQLKVVMDAARAVGNEAMVGVVLGSAMSGRLEAQHAEPPQPEAAKMFEQLIRYALGQKVAR